MNYSTEFDLLIDFGFCICSVRRFKIDVKILRVVMPKEAYQANKNTNDHVFSENTNGYIFLTFFSQQVAGAVFQNSLFGMAFTLPTYYINAALIGSVSEIFSLFFLFYQFLKTTREQKNFTSEVMAYVLLT